MGVIRKHIEEYRSPRRIGHAISQNVSHAFRLELTPIETWCSRFRQCRATSGRYTGPR